MMVVATARSEPYQNISALSIPLNLTLLKFTCGVSIVICSDTVDCCHGNGTKEGEVSHDDFAACSAISDGFD